MDARAETEAHLETSSGFIDERARGEYMRLGAGCFLVAVTNAHSALLAIVFARNGYDLHDIGLLLSVFALPSSYRRSSPARSPTGSARFRPCALQWCCSRSAF